MGNRSLQSEQSTQSSPTQDQSAALELCGMKLLEVEPAERYVRQLWQHWIKPWNIVAVV